MRLEKVSNTVLVATFTMNNKGPNGEKNYVDVGAKNTAVWLTEHNNQIRADMIIGPDDRASFIGVRYNGDNPQIIKNTINGPQEIDCRVREDVKIVGLSDNTNAKVLSKHYDGFFEEYTVFQTDNPDQFIGRHQLISGMNNAGLGERFLTSYLGLRYTDHTNIPYGRELR